MNFRLLFLSFSVIFALMTASSFQASVEVDQGNMTGLQKHVSFFDRNKDGIIYPNETSEGFRAIGFSADLAKKAADFVHAGLSAKTRPGLPIDPKLPIVVKNIHLGKSTSDTDTYDEAGRFVPSKFEEIFAKHAHIDKNSLTSGEVGELIKAIQDPKDKAGSFAASTAWTTLYNLGKDKNGLLQKETVHAVYDGSLFDKLAKSKA